jgi:hypothetical protein
LQPTDREGKAGHAAGHDRGCATLAYTSGLPGKVGRKARIPNAIARLVEKRNTAQDEKDPGPERTLK